MSAVAIIPARGGSKRIPNKNIKDFAGKPIIAYSIEVAKASRLFNRVIVSTDSESIAEIARGYGAEIPFMRPRELADDYTGTDSVVLHALDRLSSCGINFNYVCCIYPTAPFLDKRFLHKGFQIISSQEITSVFSVTAFNYPIFRALKLNSDGHLEMFWPEYQPTRSQDLPEAYHDAGQFYWANIVKYQKEKRFFSKNAKPVLIPRELVHDIDTLEDWHYAELMYRVLTN
jgi:pseudaminic acid cytidylyltransferase